MTVVASSVRGMFASLSSARDRITVPRMAGMRLPGAIVTGLVVLLSGCMFEPANETALGSQREVVEFRGVAATPRAFVRIQAAAAPDGPFAQIATGFADA